jgi:hypothetical protein
MTTHVVPAERFMAAESQMIDQSEQNKTTQDKTK